MTTKKKKTKTSGKQKGSDQALHVAAAKAYETEDFVKAQELYQQLLQNPTLQPAILHRLGVIAFKQQDLPQALSYLEAAIKAAPLESLYYISLGSLHRLQKNYAVAEKILQQAIALQPEQAAAWNALGYCYFCQKSYSAAIECYQRALAYQAYNTEILMNLALAYHESGQIPEAAAQYQKILHLNPRHVSALINSAVILRQQGAYEQAVDRYQRALALEPHSASALNNLGNAYSGLRDFEQALASYQKALVYNPNYVDALNSCGWSLHCLGKPEEALLYYDKALAVEPNHVETHWNRALSLLMLGNFAEGWAEYEYRWQKKDFIPYPTFPGKQAWKGDNIGKKTLLVTGEQGFGDIIQFARYLSDVKPLVGKLIVRCRTPLVNLLKQHPACDEVIADDDDLPAFDQFCALLSLPLLLKATVEKIPQQVPYFSIKKNSTAAKMLPNYKAGQLHIGICWGGSPTNVKLRYRSCPVEQFLIFDQLSNVQLYSLQKGPQQVDLQRLPHGSIIDLGENIADFADTAQYMQHLDLVISIDTGVAHLAGALGVPAWVITPYPADWRWLLEADKTVWYPSMQLFRQTPSDTWDSIFTRVYDALNAWSEQQEIA